MTRKLAVFPVKFLPRVEPLEDRLLLSAPAHRRASPLPAVDASFLIQQLINVTPDGGTLALAPGVYLIGHTIDLTHSITLTTAGKSPEMPPCQLNAHSDCAELEAAPGLIGPVLRGQCDGLNIDHIVVNGNKAHRTSGARAAGRAYYQNGSNIILNTSHSTITNNLFENALCGTALELGGPGVQLVVAGNTAANNGVHDASQLWSDGITVNDPQDSVFRGNLLINNTDVDLIFGGAVNCVIQDNLVRHYGGSRSSAFAGIMIQQWPGHSNGNYTGTDISGNTVLGGPGRGVGFGFELGGSSWYQGTDIFGGVVHDNLVSGAELGFNVDDVRGMTIYNNVVRHSGGDFPTSLGPRLMTAYNLSPLAHDNDFTLDGVLHRGLYARQSFVNAIPNWPQ